VSVTIYGRHDGDVIFSEAGDDDATRIPARVVHVLTHDAGIRGAKHIAWAGRKFLRGSLEAIRSDLDANALHELDTCTADGCEDAAPFNMRDTRPVCARHAKDD
jgi:hypothetical protein